MPSTHQDFAPLFEDFLHWSPAASFLRDSAGTYRWVNQAYASLYDLTPEKMLGHQLEAFDPPMLAAVYREADTVVLRHQTSLRHTLPLAPGGVSGEAAGYRFRVTLPDRSLGVGGVYVDTTALAEARERAMTAEARYRGAFDLATSPMALVTNQGSILRTNPALTRLLRRSEHDLIGRRTSELYDAERHPEATHAFIHVAEQRKANDTAGPLHLRNGAFGLVAFASTGSAESTVVITFTPWRRAFGTAPVRLPATTTAVLELVAAGTDNADIAKELFLSRSGVDYHLRTLRAALGAHGRGDLVARAYCTGLFDTGTWPPKVVSAWSPTG